MADSDRVKRLRLMQEQARLRAQQAQPRTPWQWIKEEIPPDDDPNSHNVGETIAAGINKAGEALTFGLIGDEVDARVKSMLPGGASYDEELARNRQREEVFERDNPGAALASEIGGGVLGAVLPMGAIGTLGRGAGLGARALASGATGAAMGGTYGFMEGEGEGGRLDGFRTGALIGAGAGVAAPVIGSGVKKVADSLVQRGPTRQALRAAQTAAEQRGASRTQYRAFEGSDAQISPQAFARLRSGVDQRIAGAGAPNIPGPLGRTPKAGRNISATFSQMDDALRASQQAGQNPALPLVAIEDARKATGRLGQEVDNIGRPTQGANIAREAVDEIDQFIDTLADSDMVAGDREAARTALKKARELWRTSRKTQTLENVIDRADSYLSGTESGLRNQIKSIIRANQKTKLFSPEEVDALKKVIGNNVVSRAVRTLGDGLGRKAAIVSGGAFGGLDGAAIGAAAGEMASQIGDSAAMRKAEIAKALISSGALQNLPRAPDSIRRVTEALTRRIGAVSPQ